MLCDHQRGQDAELGPLGLGENNVETRGSVGWLSQGSHWGGTKGMFTLPAVGSKGAGVVFCSSEADVKRRKLRYPVMCRSSGLLIKLVSRLKGSVAVL